MPRDTRPACRGTLHSCRSRPTPSAVRRRSSSRRAPLLEQVSPFTHAVADALDPHSAAADDVGALDAVDPATMARRLVDVPTLQDALIKVADAVPVAGEIVGPAGLPGPPGLVSRHARRYARRRHTDAGTAAAPVWAREGFHRPVGQGPCVPRSASRPRARWAAARRMRFPPPPAWKCCTTHFSCTTTLKTAATGGAASPTMHRRAGIPIAVNTGDAMNALAMRFFRKTGERLGPAAALRIFDEVDHMLVETLEGQAIELGWVRDNDLTVRTDDYLRLVLKKTAWYSFIHPMRIGALVANGEDQNLGRFDRFGYLLGLAFQITDDVLNLIGDVGRYGKEIDGDLWEGKRTLLLAHALGHANPTDRAWISTFLARPRERRLPREVLRLHQIIADGGSIPWAQRVGSRICRGCGARIPRLGVRRCACRSRPRMAARLHRLPDPARRVIGFRLECMGTS